MEVWALAQACSGCNLRIILGQRFEPLRKPLACQVVVQDYKQKINKETGRKCDQVGHKF